MLLTSLSSFAADKDCSVDIVFPFGVETVEGVEVVSSMNGAIESLPTKYVYEEINKALAPKNIGISERGEHADFSLIVGFTGMMNRKGAVITDSYIRTRGYNKSVEARKESNILMLLNKENKRVKKLFKRVLKKFAREMDECFQ